MTDEDPPQWAMDLARGPAGKALQWLLEQGWPQDRAVALVLAAVKERQDPIETARRMVELAREFRGGSP